MSEPADPSPAETPPRRPGRTAVLAYRALGLVCVGLAIVGAFLPVMPTTVFLIVALWAFARGSPEWADRLRAHPRFGPYLRDWEARGAIPRRAKVLAATMMAASWVIVAVTTRSLIVSAIVGAVLLAVGGYVVTRPSA